MTALPVADLDETGGTTLVPVPLTVALVGCGKVKADAAAPARELYTGALFRKAAAYAEAHADEWYVLSAFHHLVAPDTTLQPYDRSFTGTRPIERYRWAHRVNDDLRRTVAGRGPVHVIVLAGVTYRDELLPMLRRWAANVSVPMDGLRIGEQLAWLTEQNARSGGSSCAR
ncbi:MAG TPA: hypothetical protein VFQ85_07470 [Mycobacteriales bacterium]|jgi:hypothetical protein|nr:hypothetical protein [Mycobacteriales bacterium]